MHKQLQNQHGTDARPKSWNASAGEDPSNPGLGSGRDERSFLLTKFRCACQMHGGAGWCDHSDNPGPQ